MPFLSFLAIQQTPRGICPFTGKREDLDFAIDSPNFWNPRALTISDGTIVRSTAAGGGLSNTLEAGTQTNPSVGQGTIVTLTDTATDVRTDMATSYAVPADAELVRGRHFRISDDGSPAAGNLMYTVMYQDDSDTGLSFYGVGDGANNIRVSGSAGVDRYHNFGISGATDNVEADIQFAWPTTGTFRVGAFGYVINPGGGDITWALRIAGADAYTKTFSDTGGARTLEIDTSTTAAITAGQLVSWRSNQAGTQNFICKTVLGFEAS